MAPGPAPADGCTHTVLADSAALAFDPSPARSALPKISDLLHHLETAAAFRSEADLRNLRSPATSHSPSFPLAASLPHPAAMNNLSQRLSVQQQDVDFD